MADSKKDNKDHEDEKDSGEDSDQEDDTDADDGDGDEQDTDGKDGDGDGKDEPKFTQAQVDEMIAKRLRRERRRAGKGDASNGDGKDGKDDKNDKSADDREARIEARLLKSEARSVARDLKVKPDRIAAVLRLADFKGITADDTEDISDALEEVLELYPEFKQEPEQDARPKTRKSGRDDSGDPKGPREWTRAEIRKLSPEQYEKHRDEITDAMRKGAIKA